MHELLGAVHHELRRTLDDPLELRRDLDLLEQVGSDVMRLAGVPRQRDAAQHAPCRIRPARLDCDAPVVIGGDSEHRGSCSGVASDCDLDLECGRLGRLRGFGAERVEDAR